MGQAYIVVDVYLIVKCGIHETGHIVCSVHSKIACKVEQMEVVVSTKAL